MKTTTKNKPTPVVKPTAVAEKIERLCLELLGEMTTGKWRDDSLDHSSRLILDLLDMAAREARHLGRTAGLHLEVPRNLKP